MTSYRFLTYIAAIFVAGAGYAAPLVYTETLQFGDYGIYLEAPAPPAESNFNRATVRIDAFSIIDGVVSCTPDHAAAFCWGETFAPYEIYEGNNNGFLREGVLLHYYSLYEKELCDQGCYGYFASTYSESITEKFLLANYPGIAKNGIELSFGDKSQGWIDNDFTARVSIIYDTVLTPVPLSATFPLLGFGLAGLLLVRRRKRKSLSPYS